MNLPIRGMSGCCSGQLVGMECVGQGESAAPCNSFKSPPSGVHLSNAKSSYCPCPVLVCGRVYFSIPIALNYKYILLGSLCFDVTKLLVLLVSQYTSACLSHLRIACV